MNAFESIERTLIRILSSIVIKLTSIVTKVAYVRENSNPTLVVRKPFPYGLIFIPVYIILILCVIIFVPLILIYKGLGKVTRRICNEL